MSWESRITTHSAVSVISHSSKCPKGKNSGPRRSLSRWGVGVGAASLALKSCLYHVSKVS